jgi:hypothetical protein
MVPRRAAPIALLAGSCYMTLGQGIDIGPFSLPIFRMLLAIGLVRSYFKKEYLSLRLNTADHLTLALGAWMMVASFFHNGSEGSGPIFISGQIYNFTLIYFLFRMWITNTSEYRHFLSGIALLVVPLAFTMVIEKYSGKNPLSVFGGVPEDVLYRAGKLRAQGPFRHPILAGTVGATCVPLIIGIYHERKLIACVGLVSCLIMVFASSSSGPIISLIAGLLVIVLWKIRHFTSLIIVFAVLTYGFLMLIMEKSPYYLLAKIDLSGGSTGWHRSFLIEQTINHFDEWWIIGTDHTRHWMPFQGIGATTHHTDITNYYIGFAVMAGLPALTLYSLLVFNSLNNVWKLQSRNVQVVDSDRFLMWTLGAGLFAHAATSISVAYFDQSLIFIWMNLSIISSLYFCHLDMQK